MPWSWLIAAFLAGALTDHVVMTWLRLRDEREDEDRS